MKISQPLLSHIQTRPDNVTELFDDEDSISDVLIDGADLGGIDLSRKSITDSLLVKSLFTNVVATHFDTSNCIYKACDFSATQFPDSSWHRITIESARCSGMQIIKGTLKNITIADSKLEIVNFRFSNFEHVLFKNCVLNDIDFYGANLKNVEFVDCTINKITFGAGRMFSVDVSSSIIEGINGVGNMNGITMSYDQVMQLTPLFAAEAGIKIK